MDNRFNQNMKTGYIVTQFPKASSIFKQYKIDYCCGGNRPIGEALEEKELDAESILKEINHLYKITNNRDQSIDWTNINTVDLVEYIVEVHHGYLKQVLPELNQYVAKVYRVHGERHPELNTIFKVFQQMKGELKTHLFEEESILFPKMFENDVEEVRKLIKEFEDDHTQVGKLLQILREKTGDYTVPKGVCNTFRLTYLKLEELEADLCQHIHIENNILFSRYSINNI